MPIEDIQLRFSQNMLNINATDDELLIISLYKVHDIRT